MACWCLDEGENDVALTSSAKDDKRDRAEIRESVLTHGVQNSARSIGRALKIAGGEKIGRSVHLVFSIDPETFILGDPGRRETA